MALTEREAYALEAYVSQHVDPLPEGPVTHLHKCKWWTDSREGGCSSRTEFASGGTTTIERWRKGRRAFRVVIEHGYNLTCRSACVALHDWLESNGWKCVKSRTERWPKRKRELYYVVKYSYNDPPRWVDHKLYAQLAHEISQYVRAANDHYRFWEATDIASWVVWLADMRARGRKPKIQKILESLIRDHLPDEEHGPVYRMVDELVRVWAGTPA